jgi:hypothetical protein
MTVLTGWRADWNDILAPSRPFEDAESWTTSLLIGDTFEGQVIDPQSLHKYTYCHGDPVNNTDPSGELFMAVAGLSIGSWRQAVTGAVTIAIAYNLIKVMESCVWFNQSRFPTPAEDIALDDARELIKATPGFEIYANRYSGTYTRVVPFEDHKRMWALEPHFSTSMVIVTDRLVNEADTVFLASTIVHEMVHRVQAPGYKGTSWGESAAYQAQSDFLRANGIEGVHVQQAFATFPNTPDQYLNDLSQSFRDHNVRSPALTR